MIRVNRQVVKIEHFPDGTQRLMDVNLFENVNNDQHYFYIVWEYEGDEECMTLWYLVNHIRANFQNPDIRLEMHYIPNARMDRVKSDKEVFTLKYFAKFINSLSFSRVYVLDPHSDVSTALFDNIVVSQPNSYIWTVIRELTDGNGLVIYFPDAGAYKRYSDLPVFTNVVCEKVYGQKERDWETGKIKGIRILDKDGQPIEKDDPRIKGKKVLMIDDIISYGGTLAYSADKLKELGVGDIYAYASHTEPSVLDKEKGTLRKRLENGIVKRVFTTGSIFNTRKPYLVEKYFKVL